MGQIIKIIHIISFVVHNVKPIFELGDVYIGFWLFIESGFIFLNGRCFGFRYFLIAFYHHNRDL